MKKNTLLFLIVLCASIKSFAQYYNAAFGINGAPLKTALHNIIKNHNTQSWPLWNYFYSTDTVNGNQVWDIYSDVPMGNPPYTFILGTNQCGTYSQESDCYNHEHSWPSTFFNDASPMRTDLHHVYPTDGYVNNKRSNYPFGKVTNATWTSQNNSKLGNSNSYPGYTDKVFEPIDSFKGDIARTYFYMSTRYENEDAGWGNWSMANGAQLTADAITLLMNWHHNDPVSQKEILRNNAIAQIQMNRNPFIDYPMFADCIWGSGDCTSIGLADQHLFDGIKVYPIPSQTILHIETPYLLSITQVSVYDILGSKVMKQEIILPNANKDLSLDISHFQEGNYLLLLNTSKGVYKKLFSKNE
ncbi:MAG: endonuclease [Bacteroidetes bacterium]|nr:endonuclease [Bacteroidota bacterium]